jgi:hypothetical protein
MIKNEFVRREDAPTPEQVEEYHELLRDISHAMHRGTRRTMRFPGSEFILPGALTDWVEPEKRVGALIERDRNYTLGYKNLGDAAHKLVVLETESVLLGTDRYITHRQMFRFEWSNEGMYDAQAKKVEIVSLANGELTVLPEVATSIGVGEIDETCEPFRYMEDVLVSEADVDCLLYRTERYGKDLLRTTEEYIGDRLAS